LPPAAAEATDTFTQSWSHLQGYATPLPPSLPSYPLPPMVSVVNYKGKHLMGPSKCNVSSYHIHVEDTTISSVLITLIITVISATQPSEVPHVVVWPLPSNVAEQGGLVQSAWRNLPMNHSSNGGIQRGTKWCKKQDRDQCLVVTFPI